jgi:hypothetical protein
VYLKMMGRLDSGLGDLPLTGVFETWPPLGSGTPPWNGLNTELLPFVILSYEGNFFHVLLVYIYNSFTYLDRIALSSDYSFGSFSFKESRPSPPSPPIPSGVRLVKLG